VARGCSPWRPAAVMGTTRSGRTLDPTEVTPSGSASFGFQGPSVRALDEGLPMKLGCSSRLQVLSRSESESRAIRSNVGTGLSPSPETVGPAPSSAQVPPPQ
jgi:hypothetical protein